MILAQKLLGKTPLQKLRFIYRVDEKMRLEHNAKGADFRNGVITEQEWRSFLLAWEARHKKLMLVGNRVRENLGLFLSENQTQNVSVKKNGREAVDLDPEIDITDIQE